MQSEDLPVVDVPLEDVLEERLREIERLADDHRRANGKAWFRRLARSSLFVAGGVVMFVLLAGAEDAPSLFRYGAGGLMLATSLLVAVAAWFHPELKREFTSRECDVLARGLRAVLGRLRAGHGFCLLLGPHHSKTARGNELLFSRGAKLGWNSAGTRKRRLEALGKVRHLPEDQVRGALAGTATFKRYRKGEATGPYAGVFYLPGGDPWPTLFPLLAERASLLVVVAEGRPDAESEREIELLSEAGLGRKTLLVWHDPGSALPLDARWVVPGPEPQLTDSGPPKPAALPEEFLSLVRGLEPVGGVG